MKNEILLLIIILLILLFISIPKKQELTRSKTNNEVRGVFISYIDYSKYIGVNSNKEVKENIDTIINNVKKMNFNTIILQVVSFSDAIYKSNVYPTSKILKNTVDIDVLDYFVKKAHQNKLKIHAWVNPYRVSSSTDINNINSNNPAYEFINTDNIKVIEGKGIFYNPAKEEVKQLIVNCVREIVTNYDIDGICFDDYFYPSNDIDNNNYNEYLKNHKYLTLEKYHLNNINELVKRVKEVVHKHNKLFGVSPDGNIDNNYNNNFADVYTWCNSTKYVDYIMPQLYYGFLNSSKPYINTVNQWNDLIKNKDIKLIIALALYKAGTTDLYAKDGINEWIDNNDILKREILIGRNLSNYDGFAIFRYDYLVNKDIINENVFKETENLQTIIKK